LLAQTIQLGQLTLTLLFLLSLYLLMMWSLLAIAKRSDGG
jgi:hypothetical protein